MPTTYRVREGDCFVSIAEASGHFWQTVWYDDGNAELRSQRKDPHLLVPGDIVEIPDLQRQEVSAAADARHRFRRKGVPSKLRIRVLREGEPRKNQPFRLEFDGQTVTGKTNADGLVEAEISGTAKKARLLVGTEYDQDIFDLDLGHLEPVTEIRGIKQRLQNLGYDVGEIDSEPASEKFVSVLREFQSKNDIEATGRLDSATKTKLESVYGC
jgi:N-acetylmuramoyl-L-alanine amidase